MKMSCPSCGFVADGEAFLAERASLDVLAAALTLPAALAGPLLQYLRLFRPPQRALTVKRLGALLGELVEPIKAAKIERHGRVWPAPVSAWQFALEEILARRDAGKLVLPLRSHGYLFEVVAAQANAAEARGESRREEQRAGRTPVGRRAPQPTTPEGAVDEVPARDYAAARQGLRSLKAVLAGVASSAGAPDAD
ncbi:MAG: hypothetical protein IT518_14595 [Burkholderiales bacterium]|nr:hypothetical protein [Burkholderiales bacterium]